MSQQTTSAEIVVDFIKGRPDLLAEMRERVNDPYRAPEMCVPLARELTIEAFGEVSDKERVLLDRMRDNGPVDWQAVANAFMETRS